MLDSIRQRPQIELALSPHTSAEKTRCAKSAVGVYAPGALGIHFAYHLGIHSILTRPGGKTSRGFLQKAHIRILHESCPSQSPEPYPLTVVDGLECAYESQQLPDILLACPAVHQIPGLIDDMVGLTSRMASDQSLRYDASTERIWGAESLPVIAIASNGIIDESIREAIASAIHTITRNTTVGAILANEWLTKIVRCTAYMSAQRDGAGADAIYKVGNGGLAILTGGSQKAREKIIGATEGKAIQFRDRGENTAEYEWRKAYTNMMTNVVGLVLSADQRKKLPRLGITTGNILARMKPISGVYEVESAFFWCKRLGTAFFRIAQAKGLFAEFSTWEDFNDKVFLRPIQSLEEFYKHIPSSLQIVANNVKSGQLLDGVPSSEEAILQALMKEAELHEGLEGERATVIAAREKIEENIDLIKNIYRKPHIGKCTMIQRAYDLMGEISYIVCQPQALGLEQAHVVPFVAKSSGVSLPDGQYAIPMTAEVFTYGPENIPGDIAYITNGAGFTLKTLDRATEAGIRLGFISDLRVDFKEGKYYLAMKMALAELPHLTTIVLEVFTTLGSVVDIASSIERISQEYPHIQFVAKMQGRNQEEGIEMLQNLQRKGVQVTFTGQRASENTIVAPLSIDEMIRAVRRFSDMPVDKGYVKLYGELSLQEIEQRVSVARQKQLEYLLKHDPRWITEQEVIQTLEADGMLTVSALFGEEFYPAVEGEAFKGAPVVIIAGYGETARLQAQLMKKAGSEVVLFHPQMHEKLKGSRDLLNQGIQAYADPDRLSGDLQRAYPGGVAAIGLCYEPYRLEMSESDSLYRERIENAVDFLLNLKSEYEIDLRSILIPTEMVPTVATKIILQKCKNARVWLIGPNSPGMSRAFPQHLHKHLKVGQIPLQCIHPGDIAIAGVGGTMIFETALLLKQRDLGVSFVVSLGGDVTRGFSARDAALMAENDVNNTSVLVYIGEPGGSGAQELAEIMRSGLTIPVIALVIGRRLPENCHIGHAGTVMVGHSFEYAQTKIDSLQESGAIIVNSPEQIAQVIECIKVNRQSARISHLMEAIPSVPGPF